MGSFLLRDSSPPRQQPPMFFSFMILTGIFPGEAPPARRILTSEAILSPRGPVHLPPVSVIPADSIVADENFTALLAG